jgi:hypothetical protein
MFTQLLTLSRRKCPSSLGFRFLSAYIPLALHAVRAGSMYKFKY